MGWERFLVEVTLEPAVTETEFSPCPLHVAIIMDGNGRWAKQRGLPRLAGHRAGTNNIRCVIETIVKHKVRYLTLYAFSTENWNRPESEVKGLFRILGQMIRRETTNLHHNGVRVRHLGHLDELSPRLQHNVKEAIELTKDNTSLNLSVAFNYGGRTEILDAVRRLLTQGINPEEVDESFFSSCLYTANLPDPDLIIRTAGELRLSNFLLWQSAYSEYYATPTLWPDFGSKDIEAALKAYSQRQRRFGSLESEEQMSLSYLRRHTRGKKCEVMYRCEDVAIARV
jgi:undecaprenyl diphosphate synthase